MIFVYILLLAAREVKVFVISELVLLSRGCKNGVLHNGIWHRYKFAYYRYCPRSPFCMTSRTVFDDIVHMCTHEYAKFPAVYFAGMALKSGLDRSDINRLIFCSDVYVNNVQQRESIKQVSLNR